MRCGLTLVYSLELQSLVYLTPSVPLLICIYHESEMFTLFRRYFGNVRIWPELILRHNINTLSIHVHLKNQFTPPCTKILTHKLQQYCFRLLQQGAKSRCYLMLPWPSDQHPLLLLHLAAILAALASYHSVAILDHQFCAA